MVFSLVTERLVLTDIEEGDLTNTQNIARDSSVMRFVLIWLENDEQVASFVQHAIVESERPDRMGYILAIRSSRDWRFCRFFAV